MSCNTNNGTERINGDLKHDELIKFKNCSLSVLLEIIISGFLPKLYRKYESLNVKFLSGYKTYAGNIPSYLQNRLRSLVTFLLEIQLKYNVSFGDNEAFYSCSCWDFRRTRLLRKHFFPIIENGRKQFSNLTKLFLNYPSTNLDRDLFKENEIDNVAYPALIKHKWKKCEGKIEEKHVVDIMDSSDFENASGENSFCFFFNKLFW